MISRRQIIPGSAGPIFAIFSPNESALHADDGSVTYFPICQGTLPWQPNNFATMKGKLLCAFFAHSPDGSTVLFCYCLLGGDTAALSRLYARLCHTFVVTTEGKGKNPTNSIQNKISV